MYGRTTGLDRFKKAQSIEPFAVTTKEAAAASAQPPAFRESTNQSSAVAATAEVPAAQPVTQIGGGQSNWQPPDWAIEPRPGVYSLDIMKDGEVLDRISLDKRRHIFGRQFHACDFVLDHQSVSRQHAAVVPHKNGSIYVIDLGSAHGTFVANERLTKDSPVELEVGQSLRFAASTRIYILRKNSAALFPPAPPPVDIDLPPPDPSDEDAVLAYNTYVNRSLNGLKRPNITSISAGSNSSTSANDDARQKASKRMRRIRVAFKDQVGGELVEIVGFSDGADVETEPGPLGVKEGSLVGKYESLIQITVIPKGKEQTSVKDASVSQTGMTEKLKQVLNKVKAPPVKNSGIYDDLYGESLPVKVGSSWAYASTASGVRETSPSKNVGNARSVEHEKSKGNLENNGDDDDDDDDDLFG